MYSHPRPQVHERCRTWRTQTRCVSFVTARNHVVQWTKRLLLESMKDDVCQRKAAMKIGKICMQSCCSKQGSKPQLTVISPTISVDFSTSKTKTFLRISSLAQRNAIVSVWGVLRLQPEYPTPSTSTWVPTLFVQMFKEETSFVRTFSPVEIPNSKLEQILAFLSLKSSSRSDPVGDSLKGTMRNGSSVLQRIQGWSWCLCPRM